MKYTMKSMKKMTNTYLKSLKVLHLLVVLTFLYLGKLVMNRKDDLLLLFILLSAVVYLLTPNMIQVLLLPLVLVMLLEFLHRCCNIQIGSFEGFSDEKLDEINVVMKHINEISGDNEFQDYILYDDLSKLFEKITMDGESMSTKDKKKLYVSLQNYLEDTISNPSEENKEEKDFAKLLQDSIEEALELSKENEESKEESEEDDEEDDEE